MLDFSHLPLSLNNTSWDFSISARMRSLCCLQWLHGYLVRVCPGFFSEYPTGEQLGYFHAVNILPQNLM